MFQNELYRTSATKKIKKSVAVKNKMKKSAITEHLVNNTCCGNNFDI